MVFASRSPDLPGAPGDGNNHVYRADLASGRIVLVDRSSSGAVANRGADHPDVSADGNRVAFASTSTNLGGGTSLKDDVYVRDLAAGTTTWASVPEDGDPAHSSARDPSISADGRRVAFTQELPEFGYGAIDEDEVFVRDLAAGTTTLASTGPPAPRTRARSRARSAATGPRSRSSPMPGTSAARSIASAPHTSAIS